MRAFFEWLGVTTTNALRAISGAPTAPHEPPERFLPGPFSPYEYMTRDIDGRIGVSCSRCLMFSWVAEMRDFEGHILARWFWSGDAWYCERHSGGRLNHG